MRVTNHGQLVIVGVQQALDDSFGKGAATHELLPGCGGGSGSADAFDHLTGAAAIFTFPCLGTAAAVANGADIFTRPGRSWRRFVSGIGR